VSGAAQAVLGATSLAKVRGTIVVVAIHPTPREIDLQRVFWRELSILGARVYERRDFETAVELVAEGVIPADLLITRIVPLSATAEAFADLEAGRAMKILVDVAGQR
jgi:(R,R)-butanediol dehydrogenase/meso-butanediol dehydrogenase/diacetyl reductase